MKANTICCYCKSKRMKRRHCRITAYTYIYRARQIVFEVGLHSREISQLSKICPHLFEDTLKFMGVFLRDYATSH